MEALKVKKVIIGKPFENYENYQKFQEIAKEKKLKVHIVGAGQRIKIEKDIYIIYRDIKEIAEKYKNNLNLLNATILKVAHHGSKSSSTQELFRCCKT